MNTTGYPDGPPTKAGPALCDFFAGMHLYGAVTTALFERERTGVGRFVEVSMLEIRLFLAFLESRPAFRLAGQEPGADREPARGPRRGPLQRLSGLRRLAAR